MTTKTDVEEIYDNALNRDEYDIRELQPDPFPPKYVFPVSFSLSPSIGLVQELSWFHVQLLCPILEHASGASGDRGIRQL